MRASDYIGNQLDTKAVEWLEAVRSHVPPRPHLRLTPDRAALIVIDMLRYFCHPDGRCFLDSAPAIVPRIKALIGLWREMKRPVIYTRHCHAGPQDLGMLGRFFSDYIQKGELDSAVIDGLAPATEDVVIEKTTYDSFLNTELETILRLEKVEQVLITGVLTHMCYETTARAAFCRGFEVFIPVDAVASSRESLHRGALISMADCVGVMTRVEEVIASCR